jgi:hypothetical protein
VADHLVKVPEDLVNQWWEQAVEAMSEYWPAYVADRAAQWAADQELEACCEWAGSPVAARQLRTARRPKPPTLAEQGLRALGPSVGLKHFRTLSVAEQDDIRAALNRLAELEAQQ